MAGRHRLLVWGGAAAGMLLPLLAIRLADRTAWDPGDLIFLVILLAGIAVADELAARVGDRGAYAAGAGIALAAALLDAWINLAVGIIGSEDNPANLIYFGVLGVGIIGAIFARFRAEGMARAMVATAIVQALAFVVALIGGLGFTGPITIFFVALWLISASLFRRAAEPLSARRRT